MFVGCVNLVLCQALNNWICERTSGTAGGGFGLTWSRISIQNSASCGSRSRMNARPSLDDKILARVRIDSASSVDARAFFHSLLKSVTIAFTREDDEDGGRGAGNSWGVGALRSCHEETRSIQPCCVLKACTPAVAAEIPIQSGPNSRMHVSAEPWRTCHQFSVKEPHDPIPTNSPLLVLVWSPIRCQPQMILARTIARFASVSFPGVELPRNQRPFTNCKPCCARR